MFNLLIFLFIKSFIIVEVEEEVMFRGYDDEAAAREKDLPYAMTRRHGRPNTRLRQYGRVA